MLTDFILFRSMRRRHNQSAIFHEQSTEQPLLSHTHPIKFVKVESPIHVIIVHTQNVLRQILWQLAALLIAYMVLEFAYIHITVTVSVQLQR